MRNVVAVARILMQDNEADFIFLNQSTSISISLARINKS